MMKRLDLTAGDTIYYVVGCDVTYSIRKTRISGTRKRSRGLHIKGHPAGMYSLYETEDGRLISCSFCERRDELDPSQVFLTREAAVRYVVDRLREEIDRERKLILQAQERLAAAERVLKNYRRPGD